MGYGGSLLTSDAASCDTECTSAVQWVIGSCPLASGWLFAGFRVQPFCQVLFCMASARPKRALQAS